MRELMNEFVARIKENIETETEVNIIATAKDDGSRLLSVYSVPFDIRLNIDTRNNIYISFHEGETQFNILDVINVTKNEDEELALFEINTNHAVYYIGV